MENKENNVLLGRMEAFFFVSIITMLFITFLVVNFDIKLFQKSPLLEEYWIIILWLISGVFVIIPAKFFPNTKYGKWWNK